MKPPSEHLEPDLGTAAFLQVRGFRLLGLHPLTAGRWAFRFADPQCNAPDSAMDYLRGEPVSARSFAEAEKSLKTLLYSQRRIDGNGNFNPRRN